MVTIGNFPSFFSFFLLQLLPLFASRQRSCKMTHYLRWMVSFYPLSSEYSGGKYFVKHALMRFRRSLTNMATSFKAKRHIPLLPAKSSFTVLSLFVLYARPGGWGIEGYSLWLFLPLYEGRAHFWCLGMTARSMVYAHRQQMTLSQYWAVPCLAKYSAMLPAAVSFDGTGRRFHPTRLSKSAELVSDIRRPPAVLANSRWKIVARTTAYITWCA